VYFDSVASFTCCRFYDGSVIKAVGKESLFIRLCGNGLRCFIGTTKDQKEVGCYELWGPVVYDFPEIKKVSIR